MIVPTVGRKVWFRPSKLDTELNAFVASHGTHQPMDATVVYVWGDRCVNLAIFDPNGNLHARTSVTLIQDGDTPPPDGYYAEWMPYQVGQARKAEGALGVGPGPRT